MPRVDKMFAFLAEDAEDDEGIIAFPTSDGSAMPMIGADMERIDSLEPMARAIAQVRGKPVTLVEFSVRRDVKVIDP